MSRQREEQEGGEQLPVVRAPEPSFDVDQVRPELLRHAREAIEGARERSTREFYARDWEAFKSWVRREGLLPFLPAAPAVVVLYLAHLARETSPQTGPRKGKRGMSPPTLVRARAAISYYHEQARHPSPTNHPDVKNVLKGLRKGYGDVKQKPRPLMPEHLARIVPWLKESRCEIRFLRDRAILLGGLAGAFRRGELSALHRGDVRIRDDGIFFDLVRQQGRTIAREDERAGTKHHAASEGKFVDFRRDGRLEEAGICPVEALREWSEASEGEPADYFIRRTRGAGVEGEPVSAKKINRLVKASVAAIGLDPDRYGAHSLRSGMATYMIHVRGDEPFRVRDYLRHESIKTLDGYVRDWDVIPGTQSWTNAGS